MNAFIMLLISLYVNVSVNHSFLQLPRSSIIKSQISNYYCTVIDSDTWNGIIIHPMLILLPFSIWITALPPPLLRMHSDNLLFSLKLFALNVFIYKIDVLLEVIMKSSWLADDLFVGAITSTTYFSGASSENCNILYVVLLTVQD